MFGYFLQNHDSLWLAAEDGQQWTEHYDQALPFVEQNEAVEVAQTIADREILPIDVWVDPGASDGEVVDHVEPNLED